MKKILFLLFVFLPVISYAAGIQVSPSSMDFEVKTEGEPVSQKLVVANPTADVQIFEVYPDEFSEIIKANPASFTLEAGARKTVMVTVDPKDLKNPSGVFRTDFSVLGKPIAETRLQTNTGVKIPLLITVSEGSVQNKNDSSGKISPGFFYATLIIVAFGLGFLTYFIKRRKKIANK